MTGRQGGLILTLTVVSALACATLAAAHGPAAPAQSAPSPDQLQFSLAVTASADRFAELGGVALAPNGGLYVLDIGNHRVLQFGPDGAFRRTWGAAGQREGLFDLVSTDLRDAEVALGIAVAPDGSVYVADKGNHRIQRFRADGTFVAAFGRYGTGPGELHSPVGLAVAQDGTVYVADTGNRRVQRFTADGRPLAAWPLSGPCPEALSGSSPWGLAVAPDGTVYVADAAYTRACVQAYDPDGRPKRGWHVPTSEEGIRNAGGRGPVALSVAPDGSLFVVAWRAEFGLYHYTPDGTLLNAWGSPISMNGYYQGVGGVAAAPDGTVFLAAGPAIVHYAESGRILDQIDARYSEYGQISGPIGLATDGAGHVYLADPANDRVQQLAPDGRFLRQWGDTPGGPDVLAEPADVAIAADGTVIVADTGHDRLAWFAPDGASWGAWGGRGGQPGQFRGPRGLAVGPDGLVHVADTGNHRVQVLSPVGAFVRQWPTNAGDPAGEFPMDVAVAGDATVRVIAAASPRVRVFGPAGEPLYNLGELGATDGQLRDPVAVAVAADGATLVTDRANDRVVRFDPCGRVLSSLGEPGDNLGQLDEPTGVAVAPDGSVYIADSGNGRLQRFMAGGATASIVCGVRDLTPSTGVYPARLAPEGSLDDAADMAAGPDGTVYVLDDYPSLRIQRLDPRGEFMAQWSLAARPPAERLRSANALTVAPDGSILVVENFNQIHRVHRYRATGEQLGFWDFTGQEDPRAIAVGPDGSVYLGDMRGPTGVQRFSPDGKLLGAWTGWAPFYGVAALAADDAGDIFTAQGATIRRYTPDGVREREWGGQGTGQGQFGGHVGDLAVLPDGTIVAADWGNQRIQRFDRDGRFLAAWGPAYSPDVPPWPFPGELAAARDGTLYALNTSQPRRLQAFRPGLPENWHAEWFPNRWLTQRPVAVTDVGNLGMDWDLGAPQPLLPTDLWSARFERPFALTAGDHTVDVTATGGVRLWVNDDLLLDAWSSPAVDASLPFTSTGAVQRVIVEYNDPGGRARLRVTVR